MIIIFVLSILVDVKLGHFLDSHKLRQLLTKSSSENAFKNTYAHRVREMAWVVKCLTLKHEDLSSHPGTHIQIRSQVQ